MKSPDWFRLWTGPRTTTIPMDIECKRKKPSVKFLTRLVAMGIALLPFIPQAKAQCDAEVSGVFTYCFAQDGANQVSGYMVGFRVSDPTGDTLNVVDRLGNNVTNRGKRINDINTEPEPATITVVPLRISGVGTDTLEYWYFGPYANGDSFDIVLVDPNNVCDTVFVASGEFDCMDFLPTTDPGACAPQPANANPVPLFFLDFSFTEFTFGGGGGGNENFDEIFLVMQRSREDMCCDLPNSARCFEFIIRLNDEDIGLAIDDVGSGSTGGSIYADSLNGFTCTGDNAMTWPFQQTNGQSGDIPLCLPPVAARDFIVLSCKPGNNVTGASIDAISNIFSPPEATIEPCDVSLEVFNVDSAFWSSPDDPNLDNLITCSGDSLFCMFFYNTPMFGDVTECAGDTFTYIVGGTPGGNVCVAIDTILYDTTYVVVYPVFTVDIDTSCNQTGDSLIMTAVISSPASGCEYNFLWSTGDTTQTIIVPFSPTEYFVTVTRGDLPMATQSCVLAVDSVTAIGSISIDCSQVTDTLYQCVAPVPPPDLNLVSISGCFVNPLIFSQDSSNNASGCGSDTLTITRYYIVDFDGDTITTTTDQDTCTQLLQYVDDDAPVITCPANITIQCTASTAAGGANGTATATDNCDATPTITSSDVTVGGACPQEYTITRTWRATDDCGNSSTCTQTIFVDDSTPPVITCPANITIQCSASTAPGGANGTATATDNCDATPTITSSDVTVGGACPQEYTITRTWRATDDCGNSSTCTQTIFVDDSTPPVITCPSNITIQCTANTAPGVNGFATATDNCDATPAITSSDVTVGGACPQEYTITRTWRATDDCGNSSTCNQIIFVDDSTPPVITCPSNITIQCTANTAPGVNGLATATDNCDATPTITSTDVTIGGACPQEYTIIRTWRATDDCGNSSTCNQTIFVDDSTPPSITCPANITIQCSASTAPGGANGTATATDNCDATPAITSTDVTVGGACPQEYTITRTWRATDDCGNSSTCTQTIFVDDSTPPSITCPANITIQCSASTAPGGPAGTATATDNCDATPTITSTDVTVGGACPQEYTITRTWRATDDCGNSSTCTQTIFVDDSTPPVITCPSNITIQCTASTAPGVNGLATATDNCDATPTITSTDVTVGGACPQEYTITRTWRATDDCGNSSTCNQIIFVDDSTPPVITCPSNITIECTANTAPGVNGFATATDNCDATPTITSTDVTVGGACPQEYTITRTWRATDDCGNSSTCNQIIFVDDSTPPTITSCPANITIQCTASTAPGGANGTATATDNCDATPTITSSDVTTGGACPQELTITRTWRAIDDCGNSSSCTQIIVVDDSTPPVITCPANLTIQCSASTAPGGANGTATATDNCDATPTITSTDVTVGGACPQEYTITRTWRATDDCGNSSTCTQTIFVDDSTPPVITCPANITIQCTASTAPGGANGTATATDNCDATPTITSTDVTVGGACPQEYTITRTWRATDDCGNSSTCVQIIIVDDSTPPVLTCPANLTILCTASTAPGGANGTATATDNCDATPTITSTDVTLAGGCPQEYTITRTWRATDDCGNSSTCLQTIFVDDNAAPAITCPANITILCTASTVPGGANGTATATDNCDATPTITSTDVTIAGGCPQEYTINRTWRATDDCGNSSSCLQTIFVDDNAAPSISCPANVTVSCASQVPPVNTGSVTTSDNCGTVTVLHVADVTTNQTCANKFTLTRTYRASDLCGNSATCSQIITVNDITLPTITCPPNITIGIGTSTLPPGTGTPTAADNCSGTPTTTFTDVTIAGECSNSFLINRTWRATDACGNSSTCLQSIFVDGPCIVDLSLTKTLDGGQTAISGGDNINFTITILNEGEVDISSVTIIDYIPVGFTLNDPDWTPGNQGSTGQSATITLSIGNGGLDPNGLNPGESVSVGITLQADINIPPGLYYNIAEILQVLDINGVDVTDDDIDSTPDNVDTNDPAGEDDHDLAEICILPLPVIVGDDYVCPGELVLYTLANPNPNNNYVWTLSGGGTIVEDNNTSILVQWQNDPGGPFQITVQEVASASCQGTAFLNVFIQALEPIACNDQIQISLNPNCEAFIDPSMILEGENEANNNYYVVITDQNGNPVPNPVTYEYIGQCLMVSVRNLCNNQSCWGIICIEDKLPPQIECTCPVGNTDTLCEITCLEVNQLLDGQIPPSVQPTVTDNCPGVTLDIQDISLNDEGCGGGYVIVTWLATDLGGNTTTCVQQFNIVPLTLETLVCPPNYIGECNTSTSPNVTGWPTILGYPLSDQGNLCNIFTGYWDHELAECGGGRKILRTWTILDWCTVEIVECQQIIKLTDTEGPALTCPDDLTVGTDFWYCYSNFSVPKPIAVDDCSEIETYFLISSAGTVVHFGNNYVVNNLPIGTHLLTWIVTDECGNSNSCTFHVTVQDNVVPVASCDEHTIVSLTNDGPGGITLVPASVFDDGSYDNCGPVTFRARRMESCIDIDWTTEGACIDDIPGGIPPINSRDRGTVHRPCVPFACCDVGAGPIMIELEVTDAAGNKNYCMVEAEVQDKIAAYMECPPDIVVSCDFWFNVQEGTYTDLNYNGNLDEDPLTPVFGNMFDAFKYDESVRDHIIINDPGNEQYFQPHNWGLDGWADDNCEVNLSVRVRVIDDCSGQDLPGNAPQGAVKLIERRFSAEGAQGGAAPATCTQRIWVVDFDPFYITDNTCNNSNPNDGVIWPCDVVLTTCPDDLSGTGEPIVFDDACSLIGISYDDTRFEFVDGACFKILRKWAIIDWCQYNPQTGYGIWYYTQVIKVHDHDGPVFEDCPSGPVSLCVADPGVTLPDNNQAFLGESNPLASSCSVHLNLSKVVVETCSESVQFDVKLYLFNGPDFVQLQGLTTVPVDTNTNEAILSFDTRNSPIQSIRLNGVPYTSKFCGNYHKILWSVQDGCGNWSHCGYLLRLEDCKQPSPVCINGLSTVVMPIGGQVTIWAKDFNASSFDDCTKAVDLLYSFSGDAYQPSFTYTCDNVPAFDVELATQIWVADEGVDHNCNGIIEWSERNKDYCSTTIVITDNNGVCSEEGSVLEGEILTELTESVENVTVTLNSVGHYFPSFITPDNGKFLFNHLEQGLDYSILPERSDNPRNGVSTLDLVKIQKHLLGIEPFATPYQYIAADANNNKSVSAIDLIEIRKLILGIYTQFPQNKSWRFVEKGFQMDPQNPWPFNESIFIPGLSTDSMKHNDFVAVKIGDVNNSAQANAQQVKPRNANGIVEVKADACDIVAGETCVMTMTIPEILEGFQWTFETESLEFVGITSEDIEIGDENVGILDNGMVTMSWNGKMISEKKSITISISWKAIQGGNLRDLIQMSDAVTTREAYTLSGETRDIHFTFDGLIPQYEFALYQNKPNPWNGITSIGFVLPKEGNAMLTVFDVTGKEVYRKAAVYQAGYNAITLSQKELPMTGILYYKLESDGYAASKKMILIR